jgi:hypothetical protein
VSQGHCQGCAADADPVAGPPRDRQDAHTAGAGGGGDLLIVGMLHIYIWWLSTLVSSCAGCSQSSGNAAAATIVVLPHVFSVNLVCEIIISYALLQE